MITTIKHKLKASFKGFEPVWKKNKRLISVALVAMALVFFITLITQNNQQAQEAAQNNEQPTTALSEPDNNPGQNQTDNENETDTEALPEDQIAIAAILNNPSEYTRTELQTSGYIENVVNHRIFTLKARDTDQNIYIITPRSLSSEEQERTQNLFDGSHIAHITGRVRNYNAQELKDRFEVALSAEEAEQFEQRQLFIIVKNIRVES